MQRVSMFIDGPSGTVIVDGQDVSSSVRSYSLGSRAGYPPTLTLEVLVNEADVEGQVLVTIPAGTAELLTALGWTPPVGYDETP